MLSILRFIRFIIKYARLFFVIRTVTKKKWPCACALVIESTFGHRRERDGDEKEASSPINPWHGTACRKLPNSKQQRRSVQRPLTRDSQGGKSFIPLDKLAKHDAGAGTNSFVPGLMMARRHLVSYSKNLPNEIRICFPFETISGFTSEWLPGIVPRHANSIRFPSIRGVFVFLLSLHIHAYICIAHIYIMNIW